MDVEVLSVDRLRFADGSPVRSASAVVAFGDGALVVWTTPSMPPGCTRRR